MSELTNSQIPKPGDEQAFERANEILWRCILRDELLSMAGRRGQKQFGVDLVGKRDGDPNHLVGIQAKQKGHGKELTEKEVRDEVGKALLYDPLLSEYIIVTTAPDDISLTQLAQKLSKSVSEDREKNLSIHVMGWGSLEREIRRYPPALKAFDPSHTSHADEVLEELRGMRAENLEGNQEILAAIHVEKAAIRADINDSEGVDSNLDEVLAGQVSQYAELVRSDPKTVLPLLESLETETVISAKLRYRIKINIATCHVALGDEDHAAQILISAYQIDPLLPNAVANKALGLLMLGEFELLAEFAQAELEVSPDDGALAGYFVQGLIHDPTVEDPLSLVPEAAQRSRKFQASYIQWVSERGKPGAWREVARAAYRDFPDEPAVAERYAYALIEEAVQNTGYQFGEVLSKSDEEKVNRSAELLQKEWSRLTTQRSHLTKDLASIAVNLMLAYRMLYRFDAAINIGEQALQFFPNDTDILERLAASLFESGDGEKAKEIVDQLDVSSNTSMMKLNFCLAAGDWRGAVNLVSSFEAFFPPDELEVAKAAKIIAEIELALPGHREALFERARTMIGSDARANMLIARRARVAGYSTHSEHFYKAGLASLKSGDDSFADRAEVAREALARDEFKSAVDALHDHIDVTRDSAELRLYAQAIAHEFPVRERATRFFAELESSLSNLPYFKQMQGVYQFRRGAHEEAVECFRLAFESDRHLSSFVALVGAMRKAGYEREADELLNDSAHDQLAGNPEDKINMAVALAQFGRNERAINLAYETACENSDRGDIVGRYCGLILYPQKETIQISDLPVAPGMWVRMTTKSGKEFEAIVGEGEKRPWGESVAADNRFIAGSLGLKAGEFFEHEMEYGIKEVWTIAEVKPRWLQAFHHLSKTFNQLFPDEEGFVSLSLEDGDVAPIIDQVKRANQAARDRVDMYLSENLPMAMVAYPDSGGSVAFSEYLVSTGESVRTCVGSRDERDDALELIAKHKRGGVVLDAHSAWRAAEFGILPVIEAQLGPLSIPASELDVLERSVDEVGLHVDQEQMSVSYDDGQSVRSAVSIDDSKRNLALLKGRLEEVRAHCRKEYVDVPNLLPELAEQILSFPSGELIFPLILARDGRLLLSEDLSLRQLGDQLFGVKGVWIQAVLISAIRHGNLSAVQYANALVLLAARGHEHVSLSVPALALTFTQDETPLLDKFSTLCRCLGGASAELESHVALGASLVNALWAEFGGHNVRACRAISIVFYSLLARYRADSWNEWLRLLSQKLDHGPRQFLFRWLDGHFLLGEVNSE